MTGPSAVLGRVLARGTGFEAWVWHQGRKGIDLESKESHAARERGTRVHELFERIAKGDRPPVTSLPVFDRNHAEALYAWFDDTKPDILHTEYRVRSERLDVNGYIDYVRRCPGCKICAEYVAQQTLDERERFGVVLGDQKHGGLHSPHSHVQVGGAYRLMWSENRPEPICGTELLGIRVRGYRQPYHVLPAVGSPAMFEHALAWYRDLIALGGPQEVQEDLRIDTIGWPAPEWRVQRAVQEAVDRPADPTTS